MCAASALCQLLRLSHWSKMPRIMHSWRAVVRNITLKAHRPLALAQCPGLRLQRACNSFPRQLNLQLRRRLSSKPGPPESAPVDVIGVSTCVLPRACARACVPFLTLWRDGMCAARASRRSMRSLARCSDPTRRIHVAARTLRYAVLPSRIMYVACVPQLQRPVAVWCRFVVGAMCAGRADCYAEGCRGCWPRQRLRLRSAGWPQAATS